MLNLRSYQADLVERTRASMRTGHKAPLLVSPCGSGKTVIFSYLAEAASRKGNRVLILAHRDELIEQISDALKQFQVPHSFVAAGRPFNPASRVHVGSTQTVVRRLGKAPRPDIIVCDEAHRAVAASWKKIFQAFPKAYRIGVTATACRLSGEPLGEVFDDLIAGPSVRELIELGHLCRYKIFAPSTVDMSGVKTRGGDYAKSDLSKAVDKPNITGDAVTHYRRLAGGKRAVVFCTSITHAQHVAAEFRAAGYSSGVIDGTMDRFARKVLVNRFRLGEIQVMTSCDILSEGFNLPSIECAIMLRPTMSLNLHIQQSGRALRPMPGKEHATILDHVGNVDRHGLPCDDRQWSLDGKQPKPKSPIKCPSCYGYQSKPGVVCEYCGAPLRDEAAGLARGGRALPEQVEGELEEIDLAKRSRARLAEQSKATTYEQLVELGKARGYKPNWARHIYEARGKKYGRNNLE